MRTCAVIVTYNRSELLIRCVAAALNQTLRPEAVMVIDNCSDIPAVDVLRPYAKEIQIFRFKQNTGGAGGFHFGMAEVFRQGFDAAWLMDDDGAPSDSCLANLVEVATNTMTGFCNPLVIDENNPEKLVFGLVISGRLVASTEEAIAVAGSGCIIEDAANPFNGSLITREAYRVLGDIKFECFIWGDEEEYFERARSLKIRVGTVVSARYYHPGTNSKTVKFGPIKSELKLCPTERSQFYFRNIGFSKARYRGIVVAIYHGLNYLGFLLKSRQFSEAWKFIGYYIDGVFNLYLLRPRRSTLRQTLTEVSRVDLVSATHATAADKVEGTASPS